MLKGTVKFYNRHKGFGFITRDDGTDDLFVSAASLSASGLKTLDVGQRVSFEVEKDPKGFKAASIKLDGPAPPSARTQPEAAPQAAPAPRITVYYDPALESHRAVAAVLQKSGEALRLVDCAASPPGREELKRLSLLLGAHDQSLVKRTDPLFFELQLDDRFLSESEFWTAIVEHPRLIDGPILASGSKARLCKTAAEAQAFFQDKQHKPAKSVSPRILAMIKGHAVPPPPEKPAPAKPMPVETAAGAARKQPEKSLKPKPQPKAKAVASLPAKPKKAAVKVAAKIPAKSAGKAKPAKRTKR